MHDLTPSSADTTIEGAILDDLGNPVNPIGSLTGIPMELLAKYQAALDATYQAALAEKTA